MWYFSFLFWLRNNVSHFQLLFLFLDVDECAQNPCSNGGVCQNMDGTYHCDCPASLVGKDCTASKNTTLLNTKL